MYINNVTLKGVTMAANTVLLTNHKGEEFSSNPHVVLSDGSTFDVVNHDCVVAWITETGKAELEESYDFQNVEPGDTMYIPISDLIAAYNEVHGYNLKCNQE
tara:strand:- start:199 stop:504 length:306 start_codon:yes stop_codon:yes gene_type:complete